MVEARRDARVLQGSLAVVWLATGLLVAHPIYRALGEASLGRLGLSPSLMYATRGAEVLLGLALLVLPTHRLLAWGQVAAVSTFTLILAVSEPRLLISPFGVLTKNLPFVAVALCTAWLSTEGWTRRVERVLGWGCAVVWLTEGLVPKVLFQQAEELDIVARSGVAFGHPEALLAAIGVAEVASFVAVLWGPPRLRQWLLLGQVAALVVLPLVVGALAPYLWVHPFGPLTKNVPLLAGTAMLWRRCSSSR